MKKLSGHVANLWRKGPAHQFWMSLIALFVVAAIVMAFLGEYVRSASMALTAVAMVVFTF